MDAHDLGAVSEIRQQCMNGELRQRRQNAQLAQLELAKAAGISRAAQAAYEAGRRSPRADVALRIAAILEAVEGRRVAS